MRAEVGRLIEPVPIEYELCSGVATIENLGFAGCLVFYAQQTMYETGEQVLVVKRKIVLPFDALTACAEIGIAFLARITSDRLRGAQPLI